MVQEKGRDRGECGLLQIALQLPYKSATYEARTCGLCSGCAGFCRARTKIVNKTIDAVNKIRYINTVNKMTHSNKEKL